MNDLKSLFKLVWKRFSVWIGLLAIFTLLINGLGARDRINRFEDSLTNTVDIMASDLGVEPLKINGKFKKQDIEKSDEIFNKFQKKYDIKFAEVDDYGYYANVYDEGQEDLDYNLMNQASMYKSAKDFISEKGMADSYYRSSLFAPIVFFVTIIGILITSIEQSFPYYEFTTMLPWKKRDEVWMKALIVFGLGALVYFINLAVISLILNTSRLANIVSLPNIGAISAQMMAFILASSILVVATGIIAGNFLGHIGMLIVSVGGLELIWQNIRVLISVIFDLGNTSIDQKYEAFIEGVNPFLKPFLSLLYTKASYPEVLAYLIIAILWAMLAYVVSQKLSGEKSGFMIISSPIEKVVKVLGILSFTSLFYVIISDTIFGTNSVILNLAIYILGLLISIKLFDILFKIRLKF